MKYREWVEEKCRLLGHAFEDSARPLLCLRCNMVRSADKVSKDDLDWAAWLNRPSAPPREAFPAAPVAGLPCA